MIDTDGAAAQGWRYRVWETLRSVGRPDSQFHWDLSSFLPDFEGSERCADILRASSEWRHAVEARP